MPEIVAEINRLDGEIAQLDEEWASLQGIGKEKLGTLRTRTLEEIKRVNGIQRGAKSGCRT